MQNGQKIKFGLLMVVALFLIIIGAFQLFSPKEKNENHFTEYTTPKENNSDTDSIKKKYEKNKELKEEQTQQIIDQFDNKDENKITVDPHGSLEEHYIELFGEKEYKQALKYGEEYANLTGFYDGDEPTKYFIKAKNYMTADLLTASTSFPPRPTASMHKTKPLEVKVSAPSSLNPAYVNDYEMVFDVYKLLEVTDINGKTKELESRSQILMIQEKEEWKVEDVL